MEPNTSISQTVTNYSEPIILNCPAFIMILLLIYMIVELISRVDDFGLGLLLKTKQVC